MEEVVNPLVSPGGPGPAEEQVAEVSRVLIPEEAKPACEMKKSKMSANSEENGSEVVLYEQPQELPENANYVFFVYLMLLIGGELVAKIGVGAMLIYMHTSATTNLAPVVLVLIYYSVFKILFNLFFWVKYGPQTPELRTTYILEILLGVGLLIFFWACFGFLKGTVAPSSLSLFLIPHIVFSVLRVCAGSDMMFFTASPFFMFLESFQLLLIAIKLGGSDAKTDWTWVLLFYYIVVIVWLVFSFLLLIFLTVMIFAVIFQPELVRDIDSMILLAGGTLLFYIIWNGFVYYYLLSGLQIMHEEIGIGPNSKSGAMPPRLYNIGIVMVVCATITLILVMFIFVKLREILIRVFNKDKVKEISMVNFAKDLKLNVKAVSDTYFQKDVENNAKSQAPGEQMNIGTCMICSDHPNEVMLDPCMHGGICKECVINLLKTNNKCPICRTDVEKVYLVFWDQEKKKFMASGIIKIKH